PTILPDQRSASRTPLPKAVEMQAAQKCSGDLARIGDNRHASAAGGLFERDYIHSRSHFLACLHAADGQQTLRSDQEPAIIHSRIWRLFMDDVPFIGSQIEGEGHRCRFSRFAIVVDALEVMRIRGSSCEIDSLITI